MLGVGAVPFGGVLGCGDGRVAVSLRVRGSLLERVGVLARARDVSRSVVLRELLEVGLRLVDNPPQVLGGVQTSIPTSGVTKTMAPSKPIQKVDMERLRKIAAGQVTTHDRAVEQVGQLVADVADQFLIDEFVGKPSVMVGHEFVGKGARCERIGCFGKVSEHP